MFKRTIFVCLLLALSISASADMKKGSVGSGGHKGYAFVTDNNGQATVTLIYDSPTADLDLVAAWIDSNGEPVIVGVDVSTMHNFAQIQFGLPANIQVILLVDSYRGASPFRVSIVSAGSESMIAVQAVEVEPVMLDRLAKKVKEIK